MDTQDIKTQGGIGGFPENPRLAASEARMVARILALGVVPEEVAAECLRGAFTFAKRAISDNNGRNYAAAMAIPLAAARVENERIAAEKEQGGITIINSNQQQTTTNETAINARLDELSDSFLAAAEREIAERGVCPDDPPESLHPELGNGHLDRGRSGEAESGDKAEPTAD